MYIDGQNPRYEASSFHTHSLKFFEKLIILAKMDKNILVEKCVLELSQTAMIMQTECSGFFLLDHYGQTRIYRLVSGQVDAWLWRNRDFQTKDDDLE